MNLHISCLIRACRECGVEYTHPDEEKNLLSLNINGQSYIFLRHITPFNSFMTYRIAKDKGYTHDLLKNIIPMPETRCYTDPFARRIYQQYVTLRSYEAIANDILTHIGLPAVLKKNRGAQGKNIFITNTPDELHRAISTIFNRRSRLYDHILLAQKKLMIKKEFRVTVFQKEVLLMYEKNIDNARFTGNVSPLHWEGARAIKITDELLRKETEQFLLPIYKVLPLGYAGMDCAIDNRGSLNLIEINTQPGYSLFVRDNTEVPLVELYKKILTRLMVNTLQ